MKTQYLNRLARRATYHKSIVDQLAAIYPLGALFLVTDQNENEIRDFYHHAYYCLFFVARFALVSAGLLDCTIHKEIDEIIKKDIPPLQQNHDQATKLSNTLNEWRDERDIADYIMNPNRLQANPQVIEAKRQAIEEQFQAWHVAVVQ